MKPNLRTRCFLALALVAGTFPSLAQVTVEVNQTDPLAVYQTINAAVSEVLPGSTILVHPGTYQEKVIISGITLRALRGPEVTVVRSPDGTGDGVTLSGNQNVALVGFRIEGFVNGIVLNTTGGDTKVANCIATGNSQDGMVIEVGVPVSAKILNNISADNGRNGITAAYRSGGAFTLSSAFNNIIYRNGENGFGEIPEYGYADVLGDYNCLFANVQAFSRSLTAGTHSLTTNDPLLDSAKNYRFVNQNSPAVNSGHPASFYYDPDGTQCDMGAYGGPEARNWWRDPFAGPTVEAVTVDPPQVRPGQTVTIRATARTE